MSNKRTPSPNSVAVTVLDVLQRANPEIIDEWAGSDYHNTKSKTQSFDAVRFDDFHHSVQPWEDFTFEAIELAFGDVLHQDIKRLQPDYETVPDLVSTRSTKIVNEGDVDKFGNSWSHKILKAPLRAAAAQLRPSSGAKQKPTLEVHDIEWVKPGSKNVRIQPDWAIFEETIKITYREEWKLGSKARELCYVVGDSKLGQKWKSEWLGKAMAELEKVRMDPGFGDKKEPSTLDVREERRYPLEQVATYCRYAQTRYAFIVTQMELVVLRIRRIHRPAGGKKHHAAVEYASIPWHAKSKLTVNLALWALGCMGMNDEHREMESPDGENSPLEKMARLTWWKFDPQEKVYQNIVSNRKISAAQWKKQYEKFIHLTEEEGNSFTSGFENRASTGSSSSSRSNSSERTTRTPMPQPTSRPQVPQQRGISESMSPSLTPQPAAQTQKVTAKATPSAVSAAPRATRSVGAPKPLASASTRSAPKPPAAAPTGSAPNPPAAASRPSRSTAASSAPRQKECIIDNVKYVATYSPGDKKWQVEIKNKTYLVEVKKKPFVKVADEELEVRWLKDD